MTAFTHYWKGATCRAMSGSEGQPLRHAASEQFRERGVLPGSRVYVVSVRQGALYLVGRMEVEHIASQEEAERLLKTEDLWEASDHIIGSGTPMRFDRIISYGIARQLQFESGGSYKTLTYEAENYLDKQTLRGIRRLSDASAQLLDAQLE